MAVLTKLRPDHNVARVMHVIGEVEGKTAIIVDDIFDTGGTLINGVDALLEKGAKEVYAACSHPVLSGLAYERIASSALKEVVVTDTIPLLEGAETREDCGTIDRRYPGGYYQERFRRRVGERTISGRKPALLGKGCKS